MWRFDRDTEAYAGGRGPLVPSRRKAVNAKLSLIALVVACWPGDFEIRGAPLEKNRMTRTRTTREEAREARPKTTPARLRRRLEGKLLPLGGTRVACPMYDPDAALIAAQGQLFTQPVRMRRGAPHRCHGNAAVLWARAMDRYQLATGYALSGGVWVSHSWVVDGKNLHETTCRFDRYFGVVLGRIRALSSWMRNFFTPYYPDLNPPAEFWEDRPGIPDLCRQVTMMPKDEVFRQLPA
jgi:hypothetical protein